MKFKDLDIGDMFNIKPARGVKFNDNRYVVVMSSIFHVGDICTIDENMDVIPLFCSKDMSLSILEENLLLKDYCKYLRDCIKWENNKPKTFEEFIK